MNVLTVIIFRELKWSHSSLHLSESLQAWKSLGMRSLQTCGGPIDDIRRSLTTTASDLSIDTRSAKWTCDLHRCNQQNYFKCSNWFGLFLQATQFKFDLFILNTIQVGFEDTSWPSPFCPKSAPWHCPGETRPPSQEKTVHLRPWRSSITLALDEGPKDLLTDVNPVPK